jgi:heme exporter protein CcmD
MNDPHLGFIVAAYLVTFVAVGATILHIRLRYRGLRVGLNRFASEASTPEDG